MPSVLDPSSTLPLPSTFWDALASQYWRKQPAVFRSVCPWPIATNAECGAALQTAASRRRSGDAGAFRLFIDGTLHDTGALGLLPTVGDSSIDTYVARISPMLGDKDVGVIINDFQALDAHIWLRAVDFLRELARRTALPWGNAMMDAFFGNYRTSFFHLHKDEQDVFTFVLAGRKRYLLWPFETLRHVVGATSGDALSKFNPQTKVDYAAWRSQALVLEAEIGDIVYWPASYWHVAEVDAGYSLSLGIGLLFDNDPTLLMRAASHDSLPRARHTWPRYYDHPIRTSLHHSASRLKSPIIDLVRSREFEHALDYALLRWFSRFGFAATPPPLSDAVTDGDYICRYGRAPIPTLSRGRQLVAFANGEVLLLANVRPLRQLFALLNSGERLLVSDLITSCSGIGWRVGRPVLVTAPDVRAIVNTLYKQRMLRRA